MIMPEKLVNRYVPLQEVTHLTIHILSGGALIETHFRPLSRQRKQLLHAAIVDTLWLPALKLCAVLGDWDRALLIPETWKEHEDWTFISYVRKPLEGKPNARHFTAVLHLRGLLPGDRSLEKGGMDLFAMPGLHWNFFDDSLVTAPDPALARYLGDQLPALQGVLEEMAQLVLHRPDIALWAAAPVWENDCVPGWKAGGYRVKVDML